MDIIKDAQKFFERHSLAVNVTTNMLLATICAICYTLLITLFVTKGLGVDSLKHVDNNILPPTVVFPLLGVLITGASSTLLTRSVEHNLWLELSHGRSESTRSANITDKESYRRAQWTVSPFIRLFYLFTGQSWLLRIGGLLLFGTALINPVLLYGVRSIAVRHVTIDNHAATKPIFSGFIMVGEQMDFARGPDRECNVSGDRCHRS